MAKPNFSPETKLEMLTKYDSGAGLTEISKMFNVSIPTVRAYIVEMGGSIRGRGRPRKNRGAESL